MVKIVQESPDELCHRISAGGDDVQQYAVLRLKAGSNLSSLVSVLRKVTQAIEITLMQNDIEFVKSALPDHYTVQESKKKGSIHCVSSIGIKEGVDGEDDEHWGYVMDAFRKHFADRFQEVYHNTCTNHVDFTIYLRTT